MEALRNLVFGRRNASAAADAHQQKASNEATQGGGANMNESVVFWRTQLDAIYARRNPYKRHRINEFLDKYAGQEVLLYRKVCHQYDLDPTRLYADPAAWSSEEESTHDEENQGDENFRDASETAEDGDFDEGVEPHNEISELAAKVFESPPNASQPVAVGPPAADPLYEQDSLVHTKVLGLHSKLLRSQTEGTLPVDMHQKQFSTVDAKVVELQSEAPTSHIMGTSVAEPLDDSTVAWASVQNPAADAIVPHIMCSIQGEPGPHSDAIHVATSTVGDALLRVEMITVPDRVPLSTTDPSRTLCGTRAVRERSGHKRGRVVIHCNPDREKNKRLAAANLSQTSDQAKRIKQSPKCELEDTQRAIARLLAKTDPSGTKRRHVARTPFKEMSWQKAQLASDDAFTLLGTAPAPAVFKPCVQILLKDVKLILDMSLGKHGEQRTPVTELRAAIGRLEANSQRLPAEGSAFVKQITDGMLDHLGCVNTDKSFKPFAVVLNAMLELAKMS